MKDLETKIKNAFQSKEFKKILSVIGILIIALFIFQAGIAVGFHKAEFSFRHGDNYYRTFGPEKRGFGMSMGPRGGFTNAHGAIGKIISINLPTITVLGQDGIEKVVLVTDKTIVQKFRDMIKSTDLKIDDFVVVIGSPNSEGRIEAKFIRLVPEPPQATASRDSKTVPAVER